MALHTDIEWAQGSTNVWIGCDKVSPACKHCYAERDSHRYGRGTWGRYGDRYVTKGWRKALETMNRRGAAQGFRYRCFINSQSDVFEALPEDHQHYAAVNEARAEFFQATEELVNIQYLLVTKRPENAPSLIPAHWAAQWPDHVWLGISGEDQEHFEKRWAHARVSGARYIYLSAEPLLGRIDLGIDLSSTNPLGTIACRICGGYGEVRALGYDESGFAKHAACRRCDGSGSLLKWVIGGGESGYAKGTRPTVYSHAQHLRDQAEAAHLLFMWKQWGLYKNGTLRLGKKASGRMLDGREHLDVPRLSLAE